ncbi:hypothetical protein [Microbacterium sp. KRD172]|uniref:hypothetical protein n=1 Tax=Microbacterium sp. KRD172 TaxID=2729727 RepID=UPI0019CFC806|nr:hypothetical protein [Microbacterium sp. KRD172]
MRSLAEELEGIDRLLADAMGSSGAGGDLRVADDAELLDGWWDPYAKWRSPHLDYQAVDEALDHERHTEPESTWNTP